MDDPHGPLAPPVPPLHGGPFQASAVPHNYLGGIEEPDNVAESEGEGNADESEDEEWSYVKPNESNEQNEKSESNKPKPDEHDVVEATTVDAQEEDIDMESQLNPNAAEFVPVSPKSVAKEHLLDVAISSSPLKGCEKNLEHIIIPTEDDFRRDVANCASSLEDDINGDLNTSAKFNDSQFVALSQCDESEVMSSTKAEFGDSVFGLGVSMNNSTSFMSENRNDNDDKEYLEPAVNDFDPTFNADREFGLMPSNPEQDDPFIPGTPKSTIAEASFSPNFDGHLSSEDQPSEGEKIQEQPRSVSPIQEESRPPTFAEIVKRQSPRSSAENSPRTTPEPPESPPPVEKRNFNPFSNENDVAAPESFEYGKKFETIQEESKQMFEDILLPEKTQDFNHANTNPFSVDNADFASFEHNTHPVNNQLDMMYSKPNEDFTHDLISPDDEKPPMTFQVETEQNESSQNETNFDDFITQNTDPMQQSFIASTENHPNTEPMQQTFIGLENPISPVDTSLMPNVPLDNDALELHPEEISEKFEVEKTNVGFGFTDDKLETNEENDSFISIVENRFEHKPTVDTISNDELVGENNFSAPLSPVKEETQDQPSVTSLQMDELHFDIKVDAPVDAVHDEKSPSLPEVSSFPTESNLLNAAQNLEGLETKMDHFSQVPPSEVMDSFLETESRENLIEAVTNEVKETAEVCLMNADVNAIVEDVSELLDSTPVVENVSNVLDSAPIVDHSVPEEKTEFSFTQATPQKEESLEQTIHVDFVPAEPIGIPVESAKVEENAAAEQVVAAEVHPVKDVTAGTPPPTPAPGSVEPIVEQKKEGLIAAAAAVAGAAVAVGAAAATTTKAATKKPTTLSSAGAKKPGVAAAKKPTDLASKTAPKTATTKPTASTKTTSPTKPVAATAVKKTATTTTTTTAAVKQSKPLAGLKSVANKPSPPTSKPTTPTSKPSTPTSSSRPSSAPKSSPTKTALKSTVGTVTAAKKPAVADKKPLTNGDVSKPASRPASSTLAAKKPTTVASKTVGATKPASATTKPIVSATKTVAATKTRAPVSSTTTTTTTSKPAVRAVSAKAPTKPSDKTGKETMNKQISSAKTAAPKAAAPPTKPPPIRKPEAKPTANGKVPAGKPVPKTTAVKKVVDDKKKAEPTQEHVVTTTNGYTPEEPLTIEANGLAKDDSPLENHIHQDALVIN